MSGLVEQLGPVAPHIAQLLQAVKDGATFSDLAAHPATTALITHLKSSHEAQPTAIFSKCPDCGFRYETTLT